MAGRVLVSGAGIGGPVAAYWLARAGFRATVVERAPALRLNGQSLDINGRAAKSVVQRMPGVLESIQARLTKEEGTATVDETGRWRARFGISAGPTNEIEIQRGELARVLVNASKAQGAEYVFGDSIKAIEQDDQAAHVTFDSGATGEYDAVLLADGIASRSRSLVFPASSFQYKPVLGFHGSYFSIPHQPELGDGTWSEWYHTTRGRSVWLRPDTGEGKAPLVRAYLICANSTEYFDGYRSLSVVEQKQRWRDLYADAGWQAKRVLDGMDGSDDFYMQQYAQLHAERWSEGRVALIGDAGYCPSPMSGMGTSCAILGAYVAAGELAQRKASLKQSGEVEAAFKAYERLCRPYIEDAQDVPLSILKYGFPDSQLGVRVQRNVVEAGSRLLQSRLGKWATRQFGDNGPSEDTKIVLPEYRI
ncbi:uncharacterized protein JCM10292_000522 [Rhodotorula paludigena]|uniref:uncharacterized protein n=1 Tax=Rhodotorula paludigena TaxID=86838 RepID=UPI00317A7B1C